MSTQLGPWVISLPITFWTAVLASHENLPLVKLRIL
jgi:hypothetical protein